MQTESLTLRSTPAAQIFLRLISVLNSGNAERITDFVAKYYDESVLAAYSVDEIAAWYVDLYTTSGGLAIHKVYMSQEHYLIVIVQGKGNGLTYIDKLKISDNNKVFEYLHELAP